MSRTNPMGILLVATALLAQAAAGEPTEVSRIVDAFDDVEGWSAHPADGVDLSIGPGVGFRGRALRLDFRFRGGGYAVARKEFALDLPENYSFSFRLRGEAPANHVEFKLIDSTGENVWWSVRRNVEFSEEWDVVVIKKRHIRFAWGPLGGGEIGHVAAIEFAITAGSGGAGTVWIDELELRELCPADAAPPEPLVSASSARPHAAAEHALDGDPATIWSPAAGDTLPWIVLDFQSPREYGGVILHWADGRHATDYALEVSDDGDSWRRVRTVVRGNGGRDYLYLPESESRYLRVRILNGPRGAKRTSVRLPVPPEHPGPTQGMQFLDAFSLADIHIQPIEWSSSREAFFQAIAQDAPRGSFPRAITGEQSYWTVVGVDGDPREGLFSEDGAIEVGKGMFSVEPFLLHSGLITWADVEMEQSLEGGFLPIPSVTWRYKDLTLTVTAVGVGDSGESSVVMRYRLGYSGAGPEGIRVPLLLAIRPFQVNPPSQTLNVPGGTAPIHDIALDGRMIRVNEAHVIVSLTRPHSSGVATFDETDGLIGHPGESPTLPPRQRVNDPFGAACAILYYDLDIPPGGQHEVDLLIPLYPNSPVPPDEGDDTARAWVTWQFERAKHFWLSRTENLKIELPESASQIVQALKSQLAYILINRAGPAIQPGARSYARSWIRDGALTSSALLRLGHSEPVREFINWYAPHQYSNGKIPCVVDHRGADPVPEHDSSGEFIFLIAEYYRYTRDRSLVEGMWSRILGAVNYLDSLRHERRTDDYLDPKKREFFGILPPSISHEGYSAKPMHSYWDDFFALRGFKDAVFLAGELGLEEERVRLAAIRDEFQSDLSASVEAAMDRHEIDYIPGCADLGDFDPTATTIALGPADATDALPETALRRTFEKYYEFFISRRDGAPWEAYTPYEIRNVGAFVRLGWRGRAHELLEFFFGHQYPTGWRQWAEVVWSEARMPHFIGDLPHTWVGSDYIRSVLDMLAYELEEDEMLVIGAGIPAQWLKSSGVYIHDLPTPYGPLTYEMALRGEGQVGVRIEGDLEVPRGGILVRAPAPNAFYRAEVNGKPAALDAEGGVVVRELPASVVLAPAAPIRESPPDG